MSSAFLKKLGFLAGFLVIVWGLFLLRQIPPSRAPYAKALGAAARLTLEREGQSVQFSKQGGSWTVTLADGSSAPIDDAPFSALLKSLEEVALEEVISTRPDGAAEYEVNAASGTQVTVSDTHGKTLVSGIFGKQASDYRHIFYQPAGSPEVYLALGIYRGELGTADPLAWRSRQLINIPEPDIQDILIERRGASRHYVRVSTDTWNLNGKPTAAEGVNRLIGTLAHLRADSFVTPQDDPRITFESLTQARLVVKSGKAQVEIRIGALDSKTPRYPMSSGKPNGIVWLSQATTDSLLEFKP